MKKNRKQTKKTILESKKISIFIFVLSIIILCSLSSIAAINIIRNKEFDGIKKIELNNLDISVTNVYNIDGNLLVRSDGDVEYGCIKSTRSTPSLESNCWIRIENNQFVQPIYQHRTYYVWLRDYDGNIVKAYTYNPR